MRIVTARRTSQLFFFALFLWFCVAATLGERFWQLRGWSVNWLLDLDPLAGIATLLSTRTLYAGLLWGLGVAVEVVFLWFGAGLQGRLGPRNLLVIGGAAGVLRWTLLSFSPPLWALVALQALHALTYTAVFLASIQLAARLSDARTASAAQLVNAALQGGVLCGLATLASGPLFDAAGARGYLAMAVMAAAGLAGALCLYRIRRLQD